MFDSILVPLDGSQLAECVFAHSVAIAKSINAEITLLRILEKSQVSASAQLFDLLNWQINKKEVTLYLEKTKAQFQDSGLKVQTSVLEGLVAEGITEYAQNQGVKLIVLSSHGRSGLTQWGLSSISQKVILSAQTSVLIVRARQQGSWNGELSSTAPLYKRILVPLDGSQRAENVLPILKQIAHFHNSEIHLVQVIQKPEMARQMPPVREDIVISNRLTARNQEEAARYLEQLKSRSSLEGISVQTRLMTSENAALTLHQMAEQEGFDLVALSAHGYSGNHQWPYGSLVNTFIMYSTATLLVVQDQPIKQEPITINMSSTERSER